jgi:uncharacterized repeat protein (TIGR01451 family)
VTIGGVAGTFTVTTVAADTTPDAFSFTPLTGVTLSTPIVSNAITVAGIDAPAAISVVGGLYSIDGGAFTAVSEAVSLGQTVRVRQTSSANALTSTTATVTIGGVAGTFTVTTVAADTTPDAFSFTPMTGVTPSTPIVSNAITVAGINAPAPISVSAGGEYAIGAGAFTAVSGTVSLGQTVRVRQTSAATPGTATTATAPIGGVTGAFTVTTAETPRADLLISNALVSGTAQPGKTLVYTLIVNNSGPNTATSVVVNDPVPQGTTFYSASPTPSSAPLVNAVGTVTWNLGSLVSGATTSLTLQVKVDKKGGASVVNTATVSSSTSDQNLANNSATVTTKRK